MRICIPTEDDNGLDARISAHFGSARYFALADTDSGSVDIQENTRRQHQHGKCEPVALIDSDRTDAVVCRNMSRRAMASLEGRGVDVLVTSGETIRDALAQSREGELRRFSADDACRGHPTARIRRRDPSALW